VNIILFGAPGAGKGTQADQIENKFKLFKISTGELLRKEIQNNTDLGIKIKSKIDKGELVSDEITNNLIVNVLSNENYSNRIIFDGYPRNLNQAKNLNLLLNKYNQKISCVLNLEADKESIIKRILGRIVCTNCGLTFNKFFNLPENKDHKCGSGYLKARSDDTKETIVNRYETYLKETLPILEYYEGQKILHKIDGNRKINEINQEICGIITSLEA